MKGRMPEKNRLRRSKIGFTNPDIAWMKAKAREIRAIFASPELAGRDLYDPRAARHARGTSTSRAGPATA